MRYLLIVDLTLAAFGAALTIAIGFVALVFTIYQDASAKIAAGLPAILTLTACFIALMVFAGIASLLLRAKKPAHWAAQAVLAVSIPVLWQIVFSTLRG
ncbi:hypothetical protein [Nevskia sp.]|uniref:hypothetical protein n=1 Tax=Nevskia sp. TaxID=1929292 RepID=UPI0025DFB7A9|nr:hypothetical protein [Nevskia sp.]